MVLFPAAKISPHGIISFTAAARGAGFLDGLNHFNFLVAETKDINRQ